MVYDKINLRRFIEHRFDVEALIQCGFLKNIGRNDYEKIAERICKWFGYKTIYEYRPVCRGKSCDGDCDGTNKFCKNYSRGNEIIKWNKLEPPELEMRTMEEYLN